MSKVRRSQLCHRSSERYCKRIICTHPSLQIKMHTFFFIQVVRTCIWLIYFCILFCRFGQWHYVWPACLLSLYPFSQQLLQIQNPLAYLKAKVSPYKCLDNNLYFSKHFNLHPISSSRQHLHAFVLVPGLQCDGLDRQESDFLFSVGKSSKHPSAKYMPK